MNPNAINRKKHIIIAIVGFAALNINLLSFSNIFLAIKNNDLAEITRLIEQEGLDVNKVTGKNGITPLHKACKKNNLEAVRLLLPYCSQETINKATDQGGTALFFACSKGNLDIVKIVLPGCKKETINKENKFLATPLYFACAVNNLNILRLLLPHCTAETINRADKWDRTSLYAACAKEDQKFKEEKDRRDNIEIVRLLLQNGAKVDEESLKKAKSRPEILKYLDLTIKYNEAKDKILFIREKEADQDAFAFLSKLVFCRSIREIEQDTNKLKSIESTLFGKFYTEFKADYLYRGFGINCNGSIHEFVKKAAEENNFLLNKDYMEKDIVLDKIIKTAKNKKFVDCRVMTLI
jgi:hypothetical protein